MPTLNLIECSKSAPLAQWQSTGLLILRLSVRVRRGAPDSERRWPPDAAKARRPAAVLPVTGAAAVALLNGQRRTFCGETRKDVEARLLDARHALAHRQP